MSTRSLIATGLVSLAILQADAGADVLQLELGQFYFRGDYPTIYSGEFQEYLAESHEGPYQRPVSELHVGGIIADLDLGSIAWIRISGPDTETSLVNPGADIDLFTLEGLCDDIETRYAYNGPNALYHKASSGSLAAEVAAVDFTHGQGDADSTFVSLGTSGSLQMWFEGDSDSGEKDSGGDDTGDEGKGDSGAGGTLGEIFGIEPAWRSASGKRHGRGLETEASIQGVYGLDLSLRINEIAPIAEWVTIDVGYYGSSVPVPGPAGALGLGVGMIFLKRRRRN